MICKQTATFNTSRCQIEKISSVRWIFPSRNDLRFPVLNYLPNLLNKQPNEWPFQRRLISALRIVKNHHLLLCVALISSDPFHQTKRAAVETTGTFNRSSVTEYKTQMDFWCCTRPLIITHSRRVSPNFANKSPSFDRPFRSIVVVVVRDSSVLEVRNFSDVRFFYQVESRSWAGMIHVADLVTVFYTSLYRPQIEFRTRTGVPKDVI